MHVYKENIMVPSQRRLFIAVLLGVLAGMGPLCTDLYLPALPEAAAYFKTDAAMVQLSLTATLLGLAIGQIFIGPISDLRGRRLPLLISLAVFVAATFLCATAPSISAFIILRFIQGLAGAGGVVLSRTVACDLYHGTELTKFFSLLMLINGIAPVLGPVIGGQILKLTNWQGIFFFLGICSILIFLTAARGLKETLPVKERVSGGIIAALRIFGVLLQNREFLRYTLVQSFVMAGMFGYIAASPFVLQTVYGLSAEMFSLCFAVNGVGIMFAAQITAHLSTRYDEKKILRCGLFLALIASIAVFIANSVSSQTWSILIPLFIVVACIGVTTTTSFSLAIRAQQEGAGSASGILGVASFLFGALASPLVGIAGGSAAWPMALVLVAANGAALGLTFSRSMNKTTETIQGGTP